MYILKWMIICLLCTIIIELLVAFFLRYRKTDLLYVILVNIITNPLVVSITYLFNILHGHKGYYISLIIMEILTLFTEGFIYKKTLNKKQINPYIFSVILNVSSYTIGLILTTFVF